MTQSQDPFSKRAGQTADNRRLGLVLLSVACVFFLGIVAKKVLLG